MLLLHAFVFGKSLLLAFNENTKFSSDSLEQEILFIGLHFYFAVGFFFYYHYHSHCKSYESRFAS